MRACVRACVRAGVRVSWFHIKPRHCVLNLLLEAIYLSENAKTADSNQA